MSLRVIRIPIGTYNGETIYALYYYYAVTTGGWYEFV